MRIFNSVLGGLFLVSLLWSEDRPPLPPETSAPLPMEDVVAHDPVIMREDGRYYLFTTGPGITVWTSGDFENWTRAGRVFEALPKWTEAIPGFNGHVWAPDINFYNGRYYLYYAVSAFGKNTSAIGLVTNRTLDPNRSSYRWEDQGIVIESMPGWDNWNAIDPQMILDGAGDPYLAFGSFWSGLKMIRLSQDGKSLLGDRERLTSLASRNPGPTQRPNLGYPLHGGKGAIEGPFIYKRGDYYYLFASTDFCCRGVDSTYKMIVGRSKFLEGPYTDRASKLLNAGGGTLLMQGNARWQGVGHNAVYNFEGIDTLVFHGYDGETDRGLPKLRIKELHWSSDDWPFVEGD